MRERKEWEREELGGRERREREEGRERYVGGGGRGGKGREIHMQQTCRYCTRVDIM